MASCGILICSGLSSLGSFELAAHADAPLFFAMAGDSGLDRQAQHGRALGRVVGDIGTDSLALR